MRIRFQADNDLNKAIVRSVVRREPAVDFQTAQIARLDHVPDAEVLLNAAGSGRILVSHDFHTMPAHFRAFVSERVFLIAQDLPIAVAVDTLTLLWAATDAEEWENRLCLIPSLVSVVVGEIPRPSS